jgi:tetratricopeptide (TPR) repeat protein
MNSPHLSAKENRLRRRAWQYVADGLLGPARVTLEALVEQAPEDAPVRMDLADVLLRCGELRASNRQLLQAASVPCRDSSSLARMARQLYFQGEIVAARAGLDRLERAPEPSASMLAEQARLRWMLGEIPHALGLMERAVAAGVNTPDASYLHAMLLQFTGDIDQAGRVLAASLCQWPDPDAAVALANLRKQSPESHHLALWQQLLERVPSSGNAAQAGMARAGFASALFKELDDLGRHDEAWQALACSNALMHTFNPYDEAGEAAVTDAIIRASQTIPANRAAPAPSPEGPTPIFVVGMTRSGTTLLDRMLSSHSQVVSAGEINDFRCQLRWMTDVPASGAQGMVHVQQRSPTIDFAELGARYLRQTQWRAQGRRFYIDKLPINFRMIHLIRRALPHAPILHMVREPMDVCFSNFKAMLGPASAYSYDMHALALYYGQYVRLTNHWRDALPDAMFDVSYARLVSEPAATMRQILQHCGLQDEEACLHPERNTAPVATPSAAQVREPIHTRAIGEWRHYARQMEPLRLALEDSPHQIPPNR